MELRLVRKVTNEDCTLGDLYLDGIWECFTLEDPVRDFKIPGKTAIPAGRYRVVYQDSPRFGPHTLTLLDVPGFTYIRIHAGNTAKDTEGCILVGQAQDARDRRVMFSQAALGNLKRKVPVGGAWITVEDPA